MATTVGSSTLYADVHACTFLLVQFKGTLRYSLNEQTINKTEPFLPHHESQPDETSGNAQIILTQPII